MVEGILNGILEYRNRMRTRPLIHCEIAPSRGGAARLGQAGDGWGRLDQARPGAARRGQARPGAVRRGQARCERAKCESFARLSRSLPSVARLKDEKMKR
jgi:hypothetical protein